MFLYTTIAFNNDSSYLVGLFVDDQCTVPFSGLPSLSIPFGCQPAQIYDEHGTFCGFAQDIYPSNNISPASVLVWVMIGIWVGAVGLFAVLIAAFYGVTSFLKKDKI